MRLVCILLSLCGPLATEPLPGGGWLVLDAQRDGGGAGPCLVIHGLPRGPRACARAPSERVPAVRRAVSPGPIVRIRRGAPVELWGETGPEVARVVVSYARPRGGVRKRRATLVRARDPFALALAGIRRPFGVFFARVPHDARRAWAVALTAGGRRLGSADFSRLLVPREPYVAFLQQAQP